MIEHAQFLELHAAYLATAAWKLRRVAVLERDKHQCQARLDGCTRTAIEVHHLSYRHWRNEPLFDLTSVCPTCHAEITRMDRGELDTIVASQQAKVLEEHRGLLAFYKAQLAQTPDAAHLKFLVQELEREVTTSA